MKKYKPLICSFRDLRSRDEDFCYENAKLIDLSFQVIWDIVSSFVYLHEVLHVIHYDVHSFNICMDENGRGILIDFGNSKLITRTDPYDLYNVCYRPPEIYLAKRHHYVSDIWALAMMWLYEKFDIAVVRDLFSVLYANKKSWNNSYFPCIYTRKLKKLIEQIPKTHRSGSHESYEWIIKYISEDKDEVYLQFLDLYMEEQSIELQQLYHEVIRHMLRHDVTKRITARELFYKMTVYNDLHNFHYIVPVFFGSQSSSITHEIQSSSIKDKQNINDDKSLMISKDEQNITDENPFTHSNDTDGAFSDVTATHDFVTATHDFVTISSDWKSSRLTQFRVELVFDSYHFEFRKELDISLNLNQTMFVNQIMQGSKNVNRQFIEYFVQKGFMNNNNFIQYIKMYNTIKNTISHIDHRLHFKPNHIIVTIVKHWFPLYPDSL